MCKSHINKPIRLIRLISFWGKLLLQWLVQLDAISGAGCKCHLIPKYNMSCTALQKHATEHIFRHISKECKLQLIPTHLFQEGSYRCQVEPHRAKWHFRQLAMWSECASRHRVVSLVSQRLLSSLTHGSAWLFLCFISLKTQLFQEAHGTGTLSSG